MSEKKLQFGPYQSLAFNQHLAAGHQEFIDTSIEGLKFKPEELKNIRFVNGEWIQVEISGETPLEGLRLENSELFSSEFSRISSRGLHLERCLLEGCSLREATFSRALFLRTRILQSDLRNADFFSSHFSSSYFENCELSYATFQASSFFGSDLPFQASTMLSQTSFKNCTFHQTNLVDLQNWESASFQDCHFIHCSMSGVQKESLGKHNLIQEKEKAPVKVSAPAALLSTPRALAAEPVAGPKKESVPQEVAPSRFGALERMEEAE